MQSIRLVVLYICLALAMAAEDSGENESQWEEGSKEQITNYASKFPAKYVTCDSLWSCEDCNTRKFCFDFGWRVYIAYSQCPQFAPYCVVNSYGFAECRTKGTTGCTGEDVSTTPAPASTSSAPVTSSAP